MQLDGHARSEPPSSDAQNVSIPDDLESAQAKLIYFYLSVRTTATADELCSVLAIDKGTALSITGTLRERGYVEKSDGKYRLN